ncbi:hypothetical protein H310_13500 [Aphanomyces invadans]|uniref:Uncharacterized protein n=1 Tax=Aphanomyces invadans TaxID=157072 RepID=A0A024TER3_9STRA|nr:hypothetical protein H310_13500 [Aphanomyces invadans]ETV92081.1 hypothetical protein H310_13500 [Aphanomyces invadans]|eukprot:XP_008879243.1 hypothetical protein H310_13500 [Aphanomyces invadans]
MILSFDGVAMSSSKVQEDTCAWSKVDDAGSKTEGYCVQSAPPHNGQIYGKLTRGRGEWTAEIVTKTYTTSPKRSSRLS